MTDTSNWFFSILLLVLFPAEPICYSFHIPTLLPLQPNHDSYVAYVFSLQFQNQLGVGKTLWAEKE